MVTLKTDYKDDVLATSMNGSRRYTMVYNDDGTVSLTDASTYSTVGTNFGGSDINATNTQINKMNYTELTATLTAGETTLTISNSEITTDTIIILMLSDKFGVSPTAMSTTTGTITAQFEAQDEDVNFIVRIQ